MDWTTRTPWDNQIHILIARADSKSMQRDADRRTISESKGQNTGIQRKGKGTIIESTDKDTDIADIPQREYMPVTTDSAVKSSEHILLDTFTDEKIKKKTTQRSRNEKSECFGTMWQRRQT